MQPTHSIAVLRIPQDGCGHSSLCSVCRNAREDSASAGPDLVTRCASCGIVHRQADTYRLLTNGVALVLAFVGFIARAGGRRNSIDDRVHGVSGGTLRP
jgi:hypothetical protein